jgi:hypothetical protein
MSRLARLAASSAMLSAGAVAIASCGTATTSQPARSQTAPPKLIATAGSSGEVTLTTATGQPVTRLPSGWYTIMVNVNSRNADFHLTGPTVERTAGASGGVALWGVHFLKGTYRYMNDRDGDARTSTRVISVY